MAHGSVVAAGPIDEVLTDEKLTAAFGMPLHITKIDGRWTARAA